MEDFVYTLHDFKAIREDLYFIAREYQKAIRGKNDSGESKARFLNAIRRIGCVSEKRDKIAENLVKKMNVVVFNTEERLNAWIKIIQHLKGTNSSMVISNCD